MSNIKVSIIVPVFNGEQYILQCLESILRQTYSNIEIIVVDDGSIDASSDIVGSLAEKDTRIRCLRKEHSGLIDTRKKGVEYADGKYVVFVDCDDWIDNNLVEFIVEHSNDGEMDIINYLYYSVGNNEIISKACNTIRDGKYNKKELEDIYHKMIFDFEKGMPGINPSLCTKAFKKELLLNAFSKVDNSITLGEDGAVSYVAHIMARSVYVSSEGFYYYRTNCDSMCHKENINNFAEIYAFQKYMNMMLEDLDSKYQFKRQIKAYVFLLISMPIRNCFNICIDPLVMKEDLPYNCLSNGCNIILYGAGKIGSIFYDKLKELGCNIVAWVDANKAGECIKDIIIDNPDVINQCEYDSIIIAIKNKNVINEVIADLKDMKVQESNIFYINKENSKNKDWRDKYINI